MTVCAIVVTYHPTLTILEELVRRARPHVDRLVIVDNGSSPFAAPEGTSLICLGRNRGIAAAQNIGLTEAASYDYALLFDQDSLPDTAMIPRLVTAMSKLGPKVAAVGPKVVVRDSGNQPCFFCLGPLRYRTVPAKGQNPIRADVLISSGSLLSMNAVRDVGGMNEDLFIDCVDNEWCMRARRNGWSIYGVPTATLEHSIGDASIIHRGKAVVWHSPLRNYYYFRNATHLALRSRFPLRWKLNEAVHLLKVAVIGLRLSDRRERLRMMLRGIRDGIAARLGPARS